LFISKTISGYENKKGRPGGEPFAKLLLLHKLASWPGEVPAIHEFHYRRKDVDARHKAGHDEWNLVGAAIKTAAESKSRTASNPLDEEEETRLKHHAEASAEVAAATAAHQWRHGRLSREWVALLFAVASFIIAQIIVVTLHFRATGITHETEQIKLARDLYKEFYVEQKPYLQVANAIEGCRKLYKSDGGTFTHLQLNEYLGFFEDLGLFMQRGALSEDLIGHYFGAFIIEAYEYPEVKSYIERIRKNFQQPDAFEDFDKVAKAIEADPRFARLAEFAKTMCVDQPANQTQGSPQP
jgi:hypothetical protein